MNAKAVCDFIAQEIGRIESERETYRQKAEALRAGIEQSRQRAESKNAAYMAEYGSQAATIQIYLNQIPTNIFYMKRTGAERPLDEGLLSRLALQANASGRVSDYEKLYETALGMQRYVERQKSAAPASEDKETADREREYVQNKNRYTGIVEQRYQGILKGENYGALVKYMAGCKANLRGMLGGSELLIGRRYTAFPFPKEYHARLKADFGSYFDEVNGRLLIPFYMDVSRGFRILLKCSGELAKLDEMVEGILYSLLCVDAGEDFLVQYIDRVRLTGEGLGGFQNLLNQKNSLFLNLPACDADVKDCLESVLEQCRSREKLLQWAGVGTVYEWNAGRPKGERKKQLLLILEGFPFSYSSEERNLIRQMIVNAGRWGISFLIATDTGKFELERMDLNKLTASYGLEGFMKLNCPSANIIPATCGKVDARILERFLTTEADIAQKTDYSEWFDLHKKPVYQEYMEVQGRKKRIPIKIPLGVDEQGGLHEVTFGGMTFAGYLMGGAGSGKSSLIDTMIAGILYHYHPDDVELWLVDFKMMGFAKYIDKLPPHIKYIVLDYSPRVVCDLLDRVSAELARRTELFARHPEWNGNIENVPVSAGLPRIFLIIDEFEKMSKILTSGASNVDMSIYKKKISSLLQEGRSSGFCVLLASQNYEAGVNILEDNAKNNIGIRIAMKNESMGEMKAVLNLQGQPDKYDDQLRYLPPHQLLIVEKDSGATKTVVHRLKALWFPDGRELLHLQDNLHRYFIPVKRKESSGKIREYADKKPNVINGKRLDAFEGLGAQLEELTAVYRGDVYFDEDIPVYLGNLQAMETRKPVWLTMERNQNLCMIAPQNYTPYAASIVFSVAKCFQSAGGSVMIIGYRRNLIYSRYRKCWEKFTCTDDALEADEWLEKVAKSIQDRSCGPLLVVLLGASEIVEDIISEKEECGAKQNDNCETPHSRDGGSAKEISDGACMTGGVKAGSSPMGLGLNRLPARQEGNTAGNAWNHITCIQQNGSRRGVHLFTVVGTVQDIAGRSKMPPDHYGHLLSFRIPSHESVMRLRGVETIGGGDDFADDSICLYSGRETFTFRPFLHKEILWGDWQVDEDGNAVRR